MTFSRPQDLVPLAVKWISHSEECFDNRGSMGRLCVALEGPQV